MSIRNNASVPRRLVEIVGFSWAAWIGNWLVFSISVCRVHIKVSLSQTVECIPKGSTI